MGPKGGPVRERRLARPSRPLRFAAMIPRRRRSRFADVVRSTVVFTLSDGSSIAGILLAEYDDVYALARTRLLSETSGRAVPVDGEVLVPKDRVRFAQVGVKIDDTRELELAQVAGSRDDR